MDFKTCSVYFYMQAAFEKDYTGISKADFEIVNIQWADSAGLSDTKELELTTYINLIQNRINCVQLGLRLHSEFMKEFNMPYLPELNFFKKYGYVLAWDGNIDKVKTQLELIANLEKKYTTIVNSKKIELANRNKNKPQGEDTDNRKKFISMLISLQKIGYKIERKETTMEDLAIIVKENKNTA